MEITGEFGGLERWDGVIASGAFYKSRLGVIGIGDSDEDNWAIGFRASNSWSGSTSTSGDHSHTVSVNVGISSQGSGQAHTHTIDSAFKANAAFDNRPSFYTLAYFVKVPSA